MKSYTPLRVHSEYSLLRGMGKCEDIAERTEKIGASACALTDYGSVSGAIDFSTEMEDAGLRPIVGCDFNICVKGPATMRDKANSQLYNQLIIAKNIEGWKDLLKLVSTSNKKENFYHKPRLDVELLKPIASKGNLVSLGGSVGSLLSSVITDGENIYPNWKRDGVRMAEKLRDIFGKNNFFIEIQLIDSKINKLTGVVANALREISSITNIPCVATPNAHYCERNDAEDQRILLCTSHKKTVGQINREIKSGSAKSSLRTFFESNNYHIPSYEDMAEFHTEEELSNTNLILDMCEKYSVTRAPEPPQFKCPQGMSPEDYLRKLSREGWAQKMSHITKDHPDFSKYGERVNHELEIFTSIGLSSYFLIVEDILKFVRNSGYITGPGRGSSAGCIVADLLGITQVDPIPYDLIFERFYNAGRNSPGKISWPDIDFDIPKAAREKTIEYMRDKYGEESVAQIITFQTLKGKASLTRVMSALGDVSFDEQKMITKCIMDESKVSDDLKGIEEEYGFSSSIIWSLENTPEKLKDWCKINKDGELEGPLASTFEQAIRLEHTKIIAGTHAAGIVISNGPVSDYCPMVLDTKGKGYRAGFEGPGCEGAGLLKLDCLGIRSLDKVMDVVSVVGGEDIC